MKSLDAFALRRIARASRARSRRRSKVAPALPVDVLFAYDDVAAAREAMNTIASSLRQQCPPAAMQPMLWRFAQLREPRWREMAITDGVRAQMIVVTLPNSSAELPVDIEAWIAAVVAQKSSGATTQLVLHASDEQWTILLQQAALPALSRALEHPDDPARFPVPCQKPSLAFAV
jgi:hypothetical protein